MKNWQKEFDKEFPNSRGVFENGDKYGIRRRAIKQFIQEKLSEQKEEIKSAKDNKLY